MRALYSFSIIIITIIISIIINLSSSLLCQTMWNQCATKSMEGSKLSDSVFYNGTTGAWCWKRQKNTKTRETKTQITQCFEMVWPILGGTMRKLTSWGSRKCCSFWVLKVLNQSYWPSKLGENWRKNSKERNRNKKKTRPQFWVLCSEIESAWNQPCWAQLWQPITRV